MEIFPELVEGQRPVANLNGLRVPSPERQALGQRRENRKTTLQPLSSGFNRPLFVRVLGEILAPHEIEGLPIPLYGLVDPSGSLGLLRPGLTLLELPAIHLAVRVAIEQVPWSPSTDKAGFRATLEVRLQSTSQQADGYPQATLGCLGRRTRPQRVDDLVPRENAAGPGKQELQERAGLLTIPLLFPDRNPLPQDPELAEEAYLDTRRCDHALSEPGGSVLAMPDTGVTVLGNGTERITQMSDFVLDARGANLAP